MLSDAGTGALRLHKRLTTAEDPAIGALDGLRQILAGHGARLRDVGEILHGTTLVTNAVIERKGARLGLLTTEGFRDVLEAGTEQRSKKGAGLPIKAAAVDMIEVGDVIAGNG